MTISQLELSEQKREGLVRELSASQMRERNLEADLERERQRRRELEDRLAAHAPGEHHAAD